MDRWVWTTFNSYQWDLNYGNPAVFKAMAEEMLFLANQGVEVLRLDAVAFIWKRLGTSCENQPEAHTIIRAFNAMAKIVSPALRNGGMEIIDTGNPHLFAYLRQNRNQRLLIINNFSEHEQVMRTEHLAAAGMTNRAREIFTQTTLSGEEDLALDGYRFMWIDIPSRREKSMDGAIMSE